MSDGNRIYDGPNMGEGEIYDDEQSEQQSLCRACGSNPCAPWCGCEEYTFTDDDDQPTHHAPDICDECHEPFSDSVPCKCDSFTPGLYYDYRNQAWVKNGRYVSCGHPDSMNCKCYGRLHEDEPAQSPTTETT